MISFILALVMATFIRRRSRRKPICPSSLLRTSDTRMTSRSCPWNPSTVFTVRILRNGLKKSVFFIKWRRYCTCALYGDIIPTSIRSSIILCFPILTKYSAKAIRVSLASGLFTLPKFSPTNSSLYPSFRPYSSFPISNSSFLISLHSIGTSRSRIPRNFTSGAATTCPW